ncbi:MAG: hypothetical protein CMB36_04370 [Euryarchaeota archaeon]|nr:hypothetical protein [Euryarchaeota archaeon]
MSSDDAQIAVEEAMLQAEILGEDVAIMSDLSVQRLRNTTGAVLEIVRCPAPLKRQDGAVD